MKFFHFDATHNSEPTTLVLRLSDIVTVEHINGSTLIGLRHSEAPLVFKDPSKDIFANICVALEESE